MYLFLKSLLFSYRYISAYFGINLEDTEVLISNLFNLEEVPDVIDTVPPMNDNSEQLYAKALKLFEEYTDIGHAMPI